MEQIGHWINGAHIGGTSGRTADVFNPATGEVQAQVALASQEEMDRAIASAAEAQMAIGMPIPQRRACMMELVRLLNRDMDKLAEAISPRTRQDLSIPRAMCSAGWRGDRILHRRTASAEGQIHRCRWPGH